MLELARKIHASRVGWEGQRQSPVWGRGLLGLVCDDWNLLVSVITEMRERPNFLLYLQSQDGFWEEIFLCCVSMVWFQWLLGATQLVLDGWMLGFGVWAQPAFRGSRFGVVEEAPSQVPDVLLEGWENPEVVLHQGADASSLLPCWHTTLNFTVFYPLCFTTLYVWAAPYLLFMGLSELLSALTWGLESHLQHVPALDWAAGLVSRNIGCFKSGQMRGLIFFFLLSAISEYSKSVSCCQEDCTLD